MQRSRLAFDLETHPTAWSRNAKRGSPTFVGDDPLPVIERAILREERVNVFLCIPLATAKCAINPIADSVDVFKRVAGKLRPSFAHQQNLVAFIMDDDGKREF